MNKRGALRPFTELIGEYPFCIGLVVWGTTVGTLTLLDIAPSSTLAELPRSLQIAWGVAISVSSLATIIGLILRRHSLLMVRALMLYATTFVIYGITIVSTVGFRRGGGTTLLMFVIAGVCLIRSRYLLEHFTVLYAANQQRSDDDEVP